VIELILLPKVTVTANKVVWCTVMAMYSWVPMAATIVYVTMATSPAPE